MPKLRKASDIQRAIAAELRESYGGALTITQVGRELGFRSVNTAKRWVADVPYCMVNGYRKYLVSDIAKKIAESRIEPVPYDISLMRR